ncbi:MAG TPA: translocation/assembly module TamB domain-containing protein [Polyangiaceae bacterium]
MASPRTTRALRLFAHALAALGLSAVFDAAAAFAEFLHIDLPVGRRFAAKTLAAFLTNTFQGRISIGTIEHLTAYSLTARQLEVYDVYGKNVLKVDELRAKANVPDILREVLLGGDRITIVIPHARVEQADAYLIPDPKSAEPTIIGAFTPVPGPPETEAERLRPKRQVRLWMPVIEIGRAYGRGNIGTSPTLEAQVAGVRGSVLVTPRGAAIDIPKFGTVMRGVGGVDAAGTSSVHIRAPGPIWWTFDGYFGSVPVGTFLRVDGNQMTITADIPRAKASELRAFLPDYPVNDDISAHLEATGEPPVLQTSGRFAIGDARITASGQLRLSGNVGLDLDVQGRGLDLRAIWPEVPRTSIDADTALAIWSKEGQLVVDVNGTTQETQIEGQVVPPIDVTGTLTAGRFDAKATLHEPGMPTKVDFAVEPGGVITFDARARRFNIQRAPRLRPITDARGELDIRMQGRIEKTQLDAKVNAEVYNLQLADLGLRNGQLSGRVRGPLNRPERLDVDALLRGRDLRAGDFAFSRVTARARGPARAPVVSARLEDDFGPSVNAKGTVVTDGGPRIDALELEVQREGVALRGQVGSVDLSGGNLELSELHLEGAGGRVDGWIRLRPNLLEAKVDANELDLDELARVLGLPRGVVGGKLRVTADVSAGRDVQRGRVFVALGNGTFRSLAGISLRMNANLEDQNVTGDLSGQVQDIGAFGATWDTQLGGHVSDPAAWRDLLGTAEIQLDRVELANAVYFMPESARVEEIRGQGYARLRVERRVPAALPSVHVDALGTRGLAVVQAPPAGVDAPSLELTSFELLASGAVDGATGTADLRAAVAYQGAILVGAEATGLLDLQEFVKAPGQLGTQLLDVPVNIVVSVPEQNLERLPLELRPEMFSGLVGGRAALGGTLLAPKFGVTLDAKNVTVLGSTLALPVNVQGNAEYEKTSGRFVASAEVFQSRQLVAEFGTKGVVRWEDLFAKPTGNRPLWTGDARLVLQGLPVQVVPALADNHVSGRTYGSFYLERTGVVPQLEADIEIRDTRVDQVSIGTGRLHMHSKRSTLESRLQFSSERGRLDATLDAPLTWQGVIPGVPASEPLHARVSATSFDSVLLQPLLSGTLTHLQGRIDADLTAKLGLEPDPKLPDQKRWTADIRGDASMRDGTLTVPALGLELRDVDFSASSRNTGRFTTIRIPKLTAKARSEQQNLEGNALLVLDGLRLHSGSSNLAIRRPMPVLVQGVTQAYVTGSASMKLAHEPDRMLMTVSLSNLRASLPRASGRGLLPIDENDQIEVEQPLREPLIDPDSEALPWIVTFNLARNVTLVRNDMTIPLSGAPELHIEDEVEIRGRIDLNDGQRTGRVILFGKSFEVERGEIVFNTGENDNPWVDITARTSTPDGTLVFVDLSGPFKEANYLFRSEPPSSNPLALLLAGTSLSESEGAGSGAAAIAGVGSVGSAAFQELFGGTPLGTVVEFRAGTTESADKSTYTAAVRLSEKVWFEGTYRLRDLNAQANTPNADDTDLSGTIDWRFRPRWSLRTEYGTLGAGLDLLWQYRY